MNMSRYAILLGSLLAVSPATAQQLALSYQNITTDATTTLKSAPGYLHTICVNTPAATGTITIYDNASTGSGKVLAEFKASMTEGLYELSLIAYNGITVVTAAASRLTISHTS